MTATAWYQSLDMGVTRPCGLPETRGDFQHVFDCDLAYRILRRTEQWVSLKILTSDTAKKQRAAHEDKILAELRDRDPDHAGHGHIIRFLDSFYHEGPNGQHLCLVYKAMGESIGISQGRLATKKLPLSLTKRITCQLLQALDYVHSRGLVHTGQPSNLLVTSHLTQSRHFSWQHPM